jgi:transcription initiation factor TFIIIB Brf1 subunit/transcription initiation factor TFIIB
MAVMPEHGVQWLRLARLNKETLQSREVKLAAIEAELRRIKECAGLPQSVVEAAEELAKRHIAVLKSLESEVAAVVVLWAAAKRLGEPRPLRDFLKCAKTDERRVKKAAWTLSGVVRLAKRPSIEYYVKVVAARVDLPAPTVKKALEILERNRRLLTGKNPWVSAAAALWLASSRGFGLLKALAEAAGTTPVSIRDAARKLRV